MFQKTAKNARINVSNLKTGVQLDNCIFHMSGESNNLLFDIYAIVC